MKPYERILKEIPCLYEYQKKQLAIILISDTLTHKTKLQTIEAMTE